MPAPIDSRTASPADAVILQSSAPSRFLFVREDFSPIPTIGQRTDLPAVTLLLDARRAPAVVTARRRTRCSFVFALGRTRPLIIPHVDTVLQANFSRRNIRLEPEPECWLEDFQSLRSAISSSCTKFSSGSSGLSLSVPRLRRRHGPDAGQTFLNELPLDFPVIKR